jgi:hypothetical protein
MILSRFFRIVVVGVIGALSVFTRLGAMHGHVNWTQSIRAYRAGQQAYDQRKWSDARKEWEAAIASNPSSRFLLYNLATADSRTGDSTAATANLMRALGLGFTNSYRTIQNCRVYTPHQRGQVLRASFGARRKRSAASIATLGSLK